MSAFSFLLLRFSSQTANIQIPLENNCILDCHHKDIRHVCLAVKKSQYSRNSSYTFPDHSSLLSTESAYRFAKLNSYNRTLFKDLVNKYWQQSIFLSAFNPITDKYVTKLARQRSPDTKEKQKRFFMDFSKALVSDPIKASSIDTHLSDDTKTSSPVQYIWKKGLNLQKPTFSQIPLGQDLIRSKIQISDFQVSQILKKSHVPLYIVVNGFRQMIISGPPNDFSNKENLTNRLRQWYHNTFLQYQNRQVAYQAWFFINPQDALEYKESIVTKTSRNSTETSLGIVPSKFDFYYHLNRQAPLRTEFRLFPDLEEVEKILYSSAHRKGLTFDSRQNMGRSYFQGQPIYLIEPMKCNIKGSRQSIHFKPCYKILHDSSVEQYYPIFLTKVSALNAWKQLHVKYPEYRLPALPHLRLYNLEDFLKDQEAQHNPDSFIFMSGPLSSIEKLKSIGLVNSQEKLQHIEEVSSPFILTCKLWVQRIVWSLTRRKPPQWEV